MLSKPYKAILLIAGLILLSVYAAVYLPGEKKKEAAAPFYWSPPDTLMIPGNDLGEMVRYGRDLVANTSFYFGPSGTLAHSTNGMNCQNCHLDAGTRFWGNNFGQVYSTYPKLRARSGKVESIYKRVNDCFERSLNGSALDTTSHEMQAIYAYIRWIGRNVPKGVKPVGTGIDKLRYLERPADPEKGKAVFISRCQTCHQANGQGMMRPDGKGYIYPPLWGDSSYNDGAGLYRLSSFAGYVKDNMPFGLATHEQTQLSTTDAWDVAAYVNSQPRPHKEQSHDWPDVSKKPFDHPFGPYADGFSEAQHKYGPYGPILQKQESLKKQSGLAKNNP